MHWTETAIASIRHEYVPSCVALLLVPLSFVGLCCPLDSAFDYCKIIACLRAIDTAFVSCCEVYHVPVVSPCARTPILQISARQPIPAVQSIRRIHPNHRRPVRTAHQSARPASAQVFALGQCQPCHLRSVHVSDRAVDTPMQGLNFAMKTKVILH